MEQGSTTNMKLQESAEKLPMVGDAIINLLDCSSDITRSLKRNSVVSQTNNSFAEGMAGSKSKAQEQ